MAKYRSVILGCGPRAYWHARAYKYVRKGEIVACCDHHEEKLAKFTAEFGLKGYTDFEKMLDDEKPDLVHLVTPPSMRVPLMTVVDDRNVPACIVEKPIACEVGDWKKLCALEAGTKTKFAVGQQVRFQEFLQKCGQAIKSGKLGKLEFMDFSAGMNISGQGTHIIDWAMFLNGDQPVTRVFGAASGINSSDRQHPAPETTMAQVVFANGVYGLWDNGFTARRVSDDKAVWKHLRIAAYAEKGHTLFEEFGRWEVFSPEGKEEGQTTMELWTEMNHCAQAGLTDSMFDWLEDEDKPSGTNLKLALHQWNVVLGLYASALWRRPVDIPFDPPDDLFAQLSESLK